jgi:alkaline phosphatase
MAIKFPYARMRGRVGVEHSEDAGDTTTPAQPPASARPEFTASSRGDNRSYTRVGPANPNFRGMRRHGRRTFAAVVLAASLTIFGTTVASGGGHDSAGRGPRNVILLLGDGMGDSEITMARDYWKGAGGRLAMDSLPETGAYTTYSVDENDPQRPEYVTDSAASATAFATGQKTANKRVATSAGDDRDLETVLELAQGRGMRTGFATTSGISTATEAAFTAHVRFRGCMGPESMSRCPEDRLSAGGPGSIAEQQVGHGVDVMLGGGRKYFEQHIEGGPDDGRTVVESAWRHGYSVAFDASGLRSVPPSGRLLGLFTDVGMSAEWDGEPAAPNPGSGPQRCVQNVRPNDQPSLLDMTRVTLSRLDNPKGFFALIEGANIDTYSHSANPCKEIGETVEFDRTIAYVQAWAARHPNTLIVVTADHGHAGQILPDHAESQPPPGVYSTLVTKDDAPLRIGYATVPNGTEQKHTGTQVRIAAQGPLAERFLGVTDNTDLFRTMKAAIGA